jgi:outer membrane protein assembly factor BamB
MRRWFTPVENGRVDMRDFYGGRIPLIEGRLRLNAPLTEDSVLRLSVYEAQGLSLNFWRGKRGLALRSYDNKGASVAYATSGPVRNRPIRVLAATDDDRNWRTNPPLWPLRMDIRFHSGLMVVSRGDVELLRAPYDGLPGEVIFEGHAVVQGLALVRTTSDLPAEPADRPIVADFARPADLKWESHVPNGMTANKLDDGSVELKSRQSQQPGWLAFPLPEDGLGLHELVVEVDDVTPGSNVGLGSLQNDPKPKASVGFFRDNNSGGLSFRWNNFGNAAMDFGVDYHGGAGAANAAGHFWLKFIGGCGLKCYTSIDGHHWARMLQPLDSPSYPLTHLMLWSPQGGQPRGIRLRRVTLRKLEAVESLAPPAEIMARAQALPIPDFAHWEAEVVKQRPAGIGASDWRRACAFKTLAAGGSVWAIRPVVDLLADEAVALPGSAEVQLKRLDELALLTNVWGDGRAAGDFMHRYEQIGARMHREGNLHPWSTLAPSIVRSPLWCPQQYSIGLAQLARTELLETVYSENSNDVARLLAHLRLWNVQDPLLAWASDWATTHGENEPPIDRNAPHVDRRHPFIEELNKEGFNLLGDFEAAMASKSYRDACQIITSADVSDSLGLWPGSRDPQLLVSVNGAIDLAISHEPQLRQTMIRDFGPVGMLQVRQAMNEGDVAAIAMATSRYRGTDAAAQAYLWLGDRAMSTGEFARAREAYGRARKIASPQIAELLAPRDRLAAAMMGDDSGQPAIEPVKLGDVQLSASDFEKLAAEMRKTHASAALASAAPGAAQAPLAPAPSGFALREIGRVDGELGENPGDFGGMAPIRDQNTQFFPGQRDRKRFIVGDTASAPITRGIDWAARQLAYVVDGRMAYVSNRFQVAAFDLDDGKRIWASGVGGEHARTHDWTLTSMRPVVVGDRLFARRLVKTGPELAALEKGDGHVVWRTRTGLLVVSDPLWVEHGLVALTLSHSDQQSILYLSTFDQANGVVVAQERLATLRETWWQHRTCQLSAVKDGLVAVFGGTVLSCDYAGKLRWVRRQEWISPQDDHDWARQVQAPPVVWHDRLFVTQPGVAAVECVDIDSGELYWRKVFAGLMRLSGIVDDRLVVETQNGLVALAPGKGDVLWYHDVGDLLEGQLCGGPGKLLYTRRERAEDNGGILRPVLVWLDPATGVERASFPLDSLKHDHPMFGPFIAGGGKLFAFAAGGESEPVRVLYELTPNGKVTEARAAPPTVNLGKNRLNATVFAARQ